MSAITLSGIRIYPIKGCAGADVEVAHMDTYGLRHDRRWMLINAQGADLHQFDYPRLANITVSLHETALFVQAPGMSPLTIPLQPQHTHPLPVRWFDGASEALPVSVQADEWFQEFLHTPCRLVFLPKSVQRDKQLDATTYQTPTGFTSQQYHLLSEGSLNDLNQRLETPVPIDRFRPNLIVSGVPAFAEDSWHTLQINQHTFHVVAPCERCAITTVDPLIGVMTGKEPMKTLARYRTVQRKVLFGQYLFSTETGTLHRNDSIHILEQQA